MNRAVQQSAGVAYAYRETHHERREDTAGLRLT